MKSEGDGGASEPDARAHFADAQPQHVRFFVPGQPVGKGRPRVSRISGHARMYTPAKTTEYEERVGLSGALEMERLGLQPLAGALSVRLDIRLQVPASWPKKKRDAALAGQLRPTGKPDMDNIIKAIYDGLNGVCWVDDAQVCLGVQVKRYAVEPGVTVEIEELE